MVLNVPTLCKICEENNEIKNGLIKSPKYGKKKQLYKNGMFYW